MNKKVIAGPEAVAASQLRIKPVGSKLHGSPSTRLHYRPRRKTRPHLTPALLLMMESNLTADLDGDQLRAHCLTNSDGETERKQEVAEEGEEGGKEHQPLGTEDLNFEKWKPKPKPRRTCGQMMADVKRFLWNPESREFMGRTGQSWSLILLFYTSLYVFLAAMSAAFMWALMWSISSYTPTYNDRVVPPGLTMSPRGNGFHITFNASDRSSWVTYVEALENYLEPYNDSTQELRNMACTREAYFSQHHGDEAAERKACQFKRSWLGGCSGLQDPDFGYSQGKPCIILQMNRIIGYLPGYGTPVNVTCALKKAEPEMIREIEFYPNNIFSMMYYPYYGKLRHVNYTSPLVAVRFSGVRLDTDLRVRCQLNGKGIVNDSPADPFLGGVSFSLEVGA
ncbi:protein ATP1B4 isoform X2 [Conger conger]|uniref:protein ATP1B4 isoform X2 n=1 Tax=Conger conger TaxID=82655 RepID=UPI002A59E556|nr:protein ATP1B4 isoform X2 [Conger conger]